MPGKYLPPEAYLPHRPPMVVLDKVLEVSDDSARCSVDVRPGCAAALFLQDDGSIPWLCSMEFMAQAIGVWSGCNAISRGEEMPPLGMLIEARDLKGFCKSFDAGARLEIKVDKVLESGPLACFDGTVAGGGRVLASGRLNVMAVGEDSFSKLFKR